MSNSTRVTQIDSDPKHLYPDFRPLVAEVLDQVAKSTGEPWVVYEGYRSVDRQLWLYGQGRPHVRPYGRPGTIVTWMRSPLNHGSGLAVDCRPQRVAQQGYNAIPRGHWDKYRQAYIHVAQTSGKKIDNPAWGNGDLQHLQWSDPAVRLKALAWIAAGMKDTAPAPPPPSIHIVVNGAEVPGADGYNENGSVSVLLRPVMNALGWDIIYTTGTTATVVQDTLGQGSEGAVREIPMSIRDGHGYMKIAALRDFGVSVDWDGGAWNTVRITEQA